MKQLFARLFGHRAAPARRSAPHARSAAPLRTPSASGATDWTHRRSATCAHDEQLSRPAQAWLTALPATWRPTQLAQTYPRVANRLALCWGDSALIEQVFNELLLDRRGGRRGFPPPVAHELLQLRERHESLPCTSADGGDRWDSRFLAVVDR